MIRYGNNTFLPALKALWKECFADEDAYIDAFFRAMYQDGHVLLEEEKEVLLGASFFLPGSILLEEEAGVTRWQKIRYVYALAVYPQYRGRGIAGKLLHRAYELYGVPLIAEPAEEGLVGGFYEPLGFSGNFYLRKAWVDARAAGQAEEPKYDMRAAELALGLSGSDFLPIQAERYCAIRDARFGTHGYVRWQARHVAFAIDQHRLNGGGAYVLRVDGREEILLFYREGQDVVVTETTLTQRELEVYFLPWISGRCRRVMFAGGVFADCESVVEVKECLMGVSYGLMQVRGYLNLTLD